jgi:hypothetical protein
MFLTRIDCKTTEQTAYLKELKMLRRGEKRRLRMDDPLGDSDTPPLASPQSPMDQQRFNIAKHS